MKHLDARFPATPPSVRTIRAQVRRIAADLGMSDVGLGDVALAVSEAATNAVVHAGATTIQVVVTAHDDELEVVLSDDGAGVHPRLDSPGAGLGMPVMATVAKHLDVLSSSAGTQVHMTFRCLAAA